MLLLDLSRTGFDSDQIESVIERFEDPTEGSIARVRLKDGSVRLVSLNELQLAADEDSNIDGNNWWAIPPYLA
jgi:hypothetical protein